ncbi:hypothetical protein BZB76_3001 [Actinomadura pelletieri DSM 43383]|uniref:ABC transporter permease n=1 Tax=Actinomadura pelletieri DSM 43383 TaxID=1120940 RepID=A0A495QNG1_9ACTN|nr:hypothetical protein [Actinomadura pelletieri]RKS74487.1 hypothetical protein BZB76_3001 [Actinomadura pelletieri DSM 43383]
MREPTGRLSAARFLIVGTVTAVIIALTGPLVGVLWAKSIPEVMYVIVQGEPLLADPEGQGPIGIDARFAVLALVAGLLSGVAAYLAGGRGNDMALLLGLAVGGGAAAVLAWRTGHMIGLGEFQDAARTARDGTRVAGVADLRARGVLVFWALAAVAVYGLLELVVRRLPSADRGEPRAGEADEVGGDEFDLESAPAGRDVDGREV